MLNIYSAVQKGTRNHGPGENSTPKCAKISKPNKIRLHSGEYRPGQLAIQSSRPRHLAVFRWRKAENPYEKDLGKKPSNYQGNSQNPQTSKRAVCKTFQTESFLIAPGTTIEMAGHYKPANFHKEQSNKQNVVETV